MNSGNDRHSWAGFAAAAFLTVSSVAALSPAITPSAPTPTASTSAVSLLATQAAIMMNGTFTPDVTPEFAALVMHNYIEPVSGSGYVPVPLRTPESLWPFSGLATLTYNESTRFGYQLVDSKYHEIAARNAADGKPDTPMLVFGYSQSAFIASLLDETVGKEVKGGADLPPTTFFLVGNTNVPNGGLMSRFNGLGLTPWTPLVFAPTDTGSPTYDVFRQYDPFADFPAYPLNALATVNALMGYLLHFTLPISGQEPWLTPVIKILNTLITPISLNPESPNYIKPVLSQYQDTTYAFVPTAKLPILDPLRWVGLAQLADDLDPVLRPLVEAGYDRSVSFGVPTPAKWGLGPDMDAALKQSWQALMHLLNPNSPAPSAATVLPAVKPAATAAPTAVPGPTEPAIAPALTQSPGPEVAPTLAAVSPTAAREESPEPVESGSNEGGGPSVASPTTVLSRRPTPAVQIPEPAIPPPDRADADTAQPIRPVAPSRVPRSATHDEVAPRPAASRHSLR